MESIEEVSTRMDDLRVVNILLMYLVLAAVFEAGFSLISIGGFLFSMIMIFKKIYHHRKFG